VADDCRLTTDDYLVDSANFPGGHAAGVVVPRSTAEVAEILRSGATILPIGAQSSLTGGATPMGETILSTAKLTTIADAGAGRVTVGAGVTVAAMQEWLGQRQAWYPPSPTFAGACAGGIVATNAAGASTFKYGSTRPWVEALTIVLADGTILELPRGAMRARDGRFRLDTISGARDVPVPAYRMPEVAKRSAGYHAEPDMDLVDLFIGSEGTLGVITHVTFRTLQPAPHLALALVPCPTEAGALALVAALRDASEEAWRARRPGAVDVSAIEHMDRRSIAIAREDGALLRHNVSIPAATEVLLLVQLELEAGLDAGRAFQQIQDSLSDGGDNGLAGFCRMLDRAGVIDDAEIALPHDTRRAADFLAIREAVPAGVNHRVAAAKRSIDPRIEKTAADMIVPFARFAEMMEVYRAGFSSRGLDFAIWGHLSDGNVHPNVIPRSLDDVVRGKEAILEFGQHVARLGGCPLAEHGVGRSPVKQALLRQLYGPDGLAQMRAVKRALDPEWRLAPGVIFARE
jgi:D-lactate dehydrogenase (cytochrome)